MGKKTIWEKSDLESNGSWILHKIINYVNDNEPCSVIPYIYSGLITFINSAEKHYRAENRELRDLIYQYRKVGGSSGDINEDLILLHDKAESYIASIVKKVKKEQK